MTKKTNFKSSNGMLSQLSVLRRRGMNFKRFDRKSIFINCRARNLSMVMPKEQSGFGYVEYMVTTLGVIFMLFAPLPGQGGETVVNYVMNAIRAFGENSSLLLSLP